MQENKSIFEGTILMNKVPVSFAERELFDGKVAIWLPEDFQELPPKTIEEIYPLANMPKLVLGNDYLDLFVGFRYTEHEIPEESMGEFLEIVRMMLEQTGPRIKILAEKETVIGSHMVSSLDLITHTPTDEVYHKLFFCLLDGKVLMGFINFSCSHHYQSIAEEIFQSFHFIDVVVC